MGCSVDSDTQPKSTEMKKNIIFDLGCVLVGLNPERCIKAFKEIGCGAIAT